MTYGPVHGFDAVPPERWMPELDRGNDHGHGVEYSNHLVELTDVELVGEHSYARTMATEAVATGAPADFEFWQMRHHACDYAISRRGAWGLVGDE